MGRPATRTDRLLRDDVRRIKALFGTTTNAYECLALEDVLSFGDFRRAMTWLDVRPEHAEAITAAWGAWRGHFLREDPSDPVLSFALPDHLKVGAHF